jgi:hypothetical protein
LKCYAPGLTGGELFAIDGCKLPSNAAKEWSGTLEELEKKKKDLEALLEKIIAQHIQFDAQAVGEKDLSGAAFSGWNIVGCGAWLGATQGINILLNTFFNPTVNASRGIAA